MPFGQSGGLARTPSTYLAAGGIGLLTLSINGLGADAGGLWVDEAATLVAADRGWSGLWAMLQSVDVVHGVYYAFMHVWVAVVGYSPLTFRLSSVLAAALTAGLTTLLGSRLFGPLAGVASGLVFLALPRTMWLATEVRSYAWATLVVVGLVLAFISALERDRLRDWALVTGLTLLAGYLFIFDAFVFPALFLAAATASGSRRVHAWLSLAVGCAGIIPLAVVAARQTGQVSWIHPLSKKQILAAPAEIVAVQAGSIAMQVLAVLVLLLMLGLYGAPAWRSRRVPGSLEVPILLVGWLLLPTVGLMAVSLAGKPMFVARYLTPSVPALALIAVGAVSAMTWPAARRALAACVLVACLMGAAAGWTAVRRPDVKDGALLAARAVGAANGSVQAVLFARHVGGYSTRTADYLYPAAFAGLTDLTIDQDFRHVVGLWETDTPLSGEATRLAGVSAVVVVVHDSYYAPALQADLATLRVAGFSEISSTGQGDFVVQIWRR